MGCQSSKQSEHAKTGKSTLPKFGADDNANAIPNATGQSVAGKLQSEQSNKDTHGEKVTFSTEEANDEVGNSGRRERPVNRSTDVKAKTIVSRSMEANEEAVSNWNQSKRNKLHNHSSELSLDKNRNNKCLDEKLRRKYVLNNDKQLQMRTRIKQSRGDPEDDTLYEVPLKMPEFDLVPSRLEESVR